MGKKFEQVDVEPPSRGFSFRNGEAGDLEFIYKLILDGAASGHFSEAFLSKEGGKGLRINLLSILTRKQRLDSAKPAYGVIYHNDGEPVGFVINSAIIGNKGLEIWMMAISKSYQGAGHGSKLLDEVMRHLVDYKGVLMARCHPSSEVMFKMLIKRGFIHKDTGASGTRILAR